MTIEGAVEVATAIHALRPGHVTPGQLRAVLIDHLTIDSLAQLGALTEVLVRAAAVRVEQLLGDPEALAECAVRASAGAPVTAAELGIEYGVLLRAAGEANARLDAGHER